MKIKRGEFGYLKYKKRVSLFGVLLMLILGISVFVAGLLLNDMSNRNIFSVIAVLFVLPGAKYLVALIVSFPYKPVSRERYEKVSSQVREGVVLYTDLVITSSEKVMHLDFVVVGYGQVIGLLGNGKQELTYVRPYLTKGVANWGNDYKVKIFDSEKKFLAELSQMKEKEVDQEEEANVKSYITSLIV